MFLDPKAVLKHLPMHASARVGDFGTGAGHYAFAAAEKLGAEGSIYAFDAFGPSLESVLREGNRYQPSFYALQSDLNVHIPLRDNLLDRAIVVNVLHQVEKRGRFIGELARVIEPGGKALVVDWMSSFRNMGPSAESVLAPAEALRSFRAAGFSVSGMLPAGTHHFAFVATAPDA